MLPFLPALILLLLQGPSNLERLAVNGRLPAALEAMHRQMIQPSDRQLTPREERVLASLMSGNAPSDLSQALLDYFQLAAVKPTRTAPVGREISAPVLDSGESPPQPEGYERFQRTRDGPLSFGALA